MSNDPHSQQEDTDWLAIAFGLALIVILVMACIAGHHVVSLEVTKW